MERSAELFAMSTAFMHRRVLSHPHPCGCKNTGFQVRVIQSVRDTHFILLTRLRISNAHILARPHCPRYAQSAVAAVKAAFVDGVTFDYESPIVKGSKDSEAYTALVRETTDAMHAANAGCVCHFLFCHSHGQDLVSLQRSGIAHFRGHTRRLVHGLCSTHYNRSLLLIFQLLVCFLFQLAARFWPALSSLFASS